MARFPSTKNFDLLELKECSRCGSGTKLIVHHQVPIVFKWVPVYLEEVLQGEDGPSVREVEAKLKEQYFAKQNRSVLCWKCQHAAFHTYTMCHYCEKWDAPGPYNACAICFLDSKRDTVRKNKLAEKERTLSAIKAVLAEL